MQNATGQLFSAEIGKELAQVPGVAAVAASQTLGLQVGQTGLFASAIDPVQFARVFKLSFEAGRAPDSAVEVALSQSTAEGPRGVRW